MPIKRLDENAIIERIRARWELVRPCLEQWDREREASAAQWSETQWPDSVRAERIAAGRPVLAVKADAG